MNRPLSLLALACLAGCTRPATTSTTSAEATAPAAIASSAAPTAAMSADATAATGDGTHLTIYSGDYDALAQARDNGADAANLPGYVLVDRSLGEDLKGGRNTLSAHDLPATLDVEALVLQPTTPGVAIVGQRFIAAPATSRDVLSAAIGKKVSVEHTAGGAKQTDAGILVAARDGLSLLLPDGRIKVIREYDNFSLVDANDLIPQRATLQWDAQAERAGKAGFRLSHPMGGMAWRAEYTGNVAPGSGCKLTLDGAAMVANRSGVGFDAARLTLVAGEPNRVRRERVYRQAMAADAVAAAAPSLPVVFDDPTPVERTSGEYRAYELPGSFRVANGATERVPLFATARDVACERVYETQPQVGVWMPPQPLLDDGYGDATGPQPVKTTVSFANDKAHGLGRALPAGRVRVFDGADFLGESRLDHTPEGGKLSLEVGTAFDLAAERKRDSFKVDRAGRTMTESFTVTLRNGKQVPVTIRVVEPIGRWRDWEIASGSVPAKKRDAQHAEFDVAVPAGGEATLAYSVRYRWPAGVRP